MLHHKNFNNAIYTQTGSCTLRSDSIADKNTLSWQWSIKSPLMAIKMPNSLVLGKRGNVWVLLQIYVYYVNKYYNKKGFGTVYIQ